MEEEREEIVGREEEEIVDAMISSSLQSSYSLIKQVTSLHIYCVSHEFCNRLCILSLHCVRSLAIVSLCGSSLGRRPLCA